eukprot:scaffold136822_cov15-Tisochrysis_lutea.AAC.1
MLMRCPSYALYPVQPIGVSFATGRKLQEIEPVYLMGEFLSKVMCLPTLRGLRRKEFLSPFPGHKHIPSSAVSLELGREMVFMLGTDLKHHPTVLVIGGKHVPQDVERTKRFISYTLDATIRWGHLLEKVQLPERAGIPVALASMQSYAKTHVNGKRVASQSPTFLCT